MDWQLPLALMIVLAATLYLGRRTWRTWSKRTRGCGGCGCSVKSTAAEGETLIPAGQLQLRIRARD
jgi:hypothetical protein